MLQTCFPTSSWEPVPVLVVQCLGRLSTFEPCQLRLKGSLHLTCTLTHLPLFSCPGVHQSGAMDHWSGERWSHTVHFNPSVTLIFVFKYLCFCTLPCVGHRWVIERRVAGTKQISTVGHLPPDPPPLSFLDSSSALSPWTTYQYRLVLHNQAGSTTGKTRLTWNVIESSQDVCVLCFTLSCVFMNSTAVCLKNECVPLTNQRPMTCWLQLHILPCIHILIYTCRTLGQYHHQTFSASWSQSTKGEHLGARVTPGEETLFWVDF